MNALQATLPISEYVAPVFDKGLSIRERFLLFHRANPWVADAMEQLASRWLSSHARVGVKAIAERVRWEYGTTYSTDFALNNNYVSHYARLLIERHPEWVDAIETRELRAA